MNDELQPERPWETPPPPRRQVSPQSAARSEAKWPIAVAMGAILVGFIWLIYYITGGDDIGGAGAAEEACKEKVEQVVDLRGMRFSDVHTEWQKHSDGGGQWWVRGKAGKRGFVCFLTYEDGVYVGTPMLD